MKKGASKAVYFCCLNGRLLGPHHRQAQLPFALADPLSFFFLSFSPLLALCAVLLLVEADVQVRTISHLPRRCMGVAFANEHWHTGDTVKASSISVKTFMASVLTIGRACCHLGWALMRRP